MKTKLRFITNQLLKPSSSSTVAFKTFLMTISESQQMVDQWIAQHGVRYFNVLTNMTILTEEIGELARVVARIYGEQSPKPNEKLNLSEEMADVLWVLICLANQTGVNLEEAFLQTITKKTNRDSLRHINNPKLK